MTLLTFEVQVIKKIIPVIRPVGTLLHSFKIVICFFLFFYSYIVDELCSPKCKIKQGHTQHNSKKDKPCQEKDPIRIMKVNFLVRNGSFLHILVPCPYKNSSQSFCCNIAHNYFYFSVCIPSCAGEQ
jgi:hypothetical protein